MKARIILINKCWLIKFESTKINSANNESRVQENWFISNWKNDPVKQFGHMCCRAN